MKLLKKILGYLVDHLCGRHSDVRTFVINFPASYILPLLLYWAGEIIANADYNHQIDSWYGSAADFSSAAIVATATLMLLILPVWGAIGAAVRFFNRLFYVRQTPNLVSILTLPIIGFFAFTYGIAVFFVFPGEFLLAIVLQTGIIDENSAFVNAYSSIGFWAYDKLAEATEELGKLLGLDDFEDG